MNIQIERLDNHTARLTVEVGTERFDKAKKEAARKLAKQYRIPGFRKGKAPYNILVRYLGEAPIIEEAMETLGKKVYVEALESDESIQPYTSGTLEDFTLDPEPTYIFTVPLEPEITLGDYHAIRKDYEAPAITDEDVEDALERLRQAHAETEDSEEPIAVGNRIVIDINGKFIDGEERPDDEYDDDEYDDDDDDEYDDDDDDEYDDDDDDEYDDDEKIYKGDLYMHRHDTELTLDPEDEPILPGFIEAVVGAQVGDDVEFELSVPDEDEHEETRGRRVQFNVTIKQVQVVTLPELDDEFATKALEPDDKVENVAELREFLRRELLEQAEKNARIEYAETILDDIVAMSTVRYPQDMLDERIKDMVADLERNFSQQGITLDDYLRVSGKSREEINEQYRPRAETNLARSLVLGQIIFQEEINIKSGEIDAEVEKNLERFGEHKELIRSLLDTPEQRANILNNMLYERIMMRLYKIGRGEPLEEESDAEAVDAEAVDAEAVDAEAVDAEAVDAEAVDAEAVDAETPDAEAPDAEAPDAEAPETEDETK